MTDILFFAQFALAVLLVIVVLLQKSSSIGLGAYSGSNESLFGSRGPNAFLAKTTAILGFLLVVNSISLTYIYYRDRDASVVDKSAIPAAPAMPAQETTAVPTAPAAPSSAVPEAPKE